jgi:hypothetical protein
VRLSNWTVLPQIKSLAKVIEKKHGINIGRKQIKCLRGDHGVSVYFRCVSLEEKLE